MVTIHLKLKGVDLKEIVKILRDLSEGDTDFDDALDNMHDILIKRSCD